MIFYQNNLEGSFDNSVRELEQLPQRVFCVTVWDTPPLNFTFPKFARGGNLPPTRVYVSVSVKLLFTRILKLLAPTFEYDIRNGNGLFYRT